MFERKLNKEEFAAIFNPEIKKHMSFFKDGKYGVLDKFGHQVLPAKFAYVCPLDNGLIIVSENWKGYKLYSAYGNLLCGDRVFASEYEAKVYAAYF